MLVNRSNVGRGRGGRALPPIFLGGRGVTIFLYGGALCAIAKTTHASRPRFTCRDTGISLIFSCPSLPRGKSLAVTQFTFSKFTLCQKISVPCVSFQNLHWIYIYIYWCRESCNEEKERVSGVFMENDPKRIFDIPSFSFMSCKIVFQIVIKNVRLSILVTKYI